MSPAPSRTATAELLAQPGIWRAREGRARLLPGWPSGHARLDALLGGGWPQGLLSEILLAQPGLGEISLLLPLLARLSSAGHRLVFVRPPCRPNVPALARAGVVLEQVLLVAVASEREALWASEQILLGGPPCALLLWSSTRDERALRRLALAAEGKASLALLLRPPGCARQASPAALRLRLDAPLARAPLAILKARGQACSSEAPLFSRIGT